MVNSSCLICGSTKLKDLTEFSKTGLVKCRNCSFVFCKRRPTKEELEKNYNVYPRTDNINPITLKRYEELLDSFEQYRSTNNIMDVGCGDGHFLAVAKKRGWNAYGTEFTERAMQLGREKGINMQLGVLDVKNYQEGMFDIITSIEVIEHINNPVEETSKFSHLLRKGGLLYITTPNFDSINRYLFKEDWSVIEYPEHLSYYTGRTLSRLLQKNGFKRVKVQTTGFSLSRFQRAMSVSKESKGSAADDVIREKVETEWHYQVAKNSINFFLSVFSVGDTLKARFIKL